MFYNLPDSLNMSSTFRSLLVYRYHVRSNRSDTRSASSRAWEIYFSGKVCSRQKYAFMSGDYKKTSGANLDDKGSTGAIHKSSSRRVDARVPCWIDRNRTEEGRARRRRTLRNETLLLHPHPETAWRNAKRVRVARVLKLRGLIHQLALLMRIDCRITRRPSCRAFLRISRVFRKHQFSIIRGKSSTRLPQR